MTQVDVIVPVYGAPVEFARCLDTVLQHTTWENRRLIVVDDGGPTFPPATDLEKQAARTGAPLLLLRNPRREGFVVSVNRAMALSGHDVVLLNSDTEVTPRWLDKLEQAAYSMPTIATATPFSNNATICSLPRFLEANLMPTGYSCADFAALVERVSLRTYPRLPTGVGVCLYIKREVLRRLGLFDERSFALGYGEESEFCMRARAAGYEHVLDDATFIFHAGQRSFGASRDGRVRRAERRMRSLYPEYTRLISRFIREDPLRPIRDRVTSALSSRRTATRSGPPQHVVHLVHGYPPHNFAGTEVYARSLAIRQAADRDVAVYARIADPLRGLGDASELYDHGVRVRLMVNNFTARSPWTRNALRSPRLERDFDRFLDETKPELLHVHHLAGHSIGLLERAARRRIRIIYQIQDWWPLCSRSNLFDHARRPCNGPGLTKCSVCLPLTRIPPVSVWNPCLYAYRRRAVKRAFAVVDAFVAGSRFIVESYRRLGLLREDAEVHVLPYGVNCPHPPHEERLVVGHPVRFGFIGSIQPHKGLHIAVEAFRRISPDRAVLEIWGDPKIDPAYTAELTRDFPPAARMHGRFPEGALDETFGMLDILLVPSLGLESFGLVVREAMCRQVPVLMSRSGALAEISYPGDSRAFFEAGNVEMLRKRIEELVDHPGEIVAWRRRLPKIESADDHAKEVDRVYASVLRRSQT